MVAIAHPQAAGNGGSDAGWSFQINLQGSTSASGWQHIGEPQGPWGSYLDPNFFNSFLRLSGVFGYSNDFLGNPEPGYYVPASATMAGSQSATLTWQQGLDNVPSPTRLWVMTDTYAYYSLLNNGLGSGGTGSATVANANYGGQLFGGYYQMQRRVKKISVNSGEVTLPAQSLNITNNPSGYADDASFGGYLSYRVYANPVLKADSHQTYRKGTVPGQRIPNLPDANGQTIEHKAVGIIPVYQLKAFVPTAGTSLSLAQSNFTLNSTIFNFSYSGDGVVSNATTMGSTSSSYKAVDILFPTIPMQNFPDEFGKVSNFMATADDATYLDYDPVDAMTTIKWHFPYENIVENNVGLDYVPLGVVEMESPGYYYWSSGTLNERVQTVTQYNVALALIANSFLTVTGMAIDLLTLPSGLTFVLAASGYMDHFEESIQKMYQTNHMPSWYACWANISNGSYQDSYPRSSFYPDRTHSQELYKMVPVPFGKYVGHAVTADFYSSEGYVGPFSQDYATYVDKEPPVGNFTLSTVGGGGGGWGPGGPI